jgi:hypothetical protein
MTQWLVRMTRPANVTSCSPANLKPTERQVPLEGPLVVAGNACTSRLLARISDLNLAELDADSLVGTGIRT